MAPACAPDGGWAHARPRRRTVVRGWGISSSERPSSVWWPAQMRSTVYGGRIRWSVGPYHSLNKGFEQRIAINRAVPYQLWSNSIMEGIIECDHRHGLRSPKVPLGCGVQLNSARYSMSTTERRQKYSTHGHCMSVRDARWRLTASLACRAYR